MDRFETKRFIEHCYKFNNKYKLSKNIGQSEISHLVDVLWEYIELAENNNIYKRELDELRKKIEVLSSSSGQRVRCIKALPNRRALIQLGPIKEEIVVSPDVDVSKLKTGVEVFVSGSGDRRTLYGIRNHDIYDGKIAKIQRTLDDNRVIVENGGQETIMKVAHWITCKEGDEIRFDPESQIILEVLKHKGSSSFSLSDISDVYFEDIKGLEEEKKYIQERLVFPIVYKKEFARYRIKPIRAILFHGASGCGKTMIAKAIFNEIFKLRSKYSSNNSATSKDKGFFLVNGPEVLSKWVGNTESTIRRIFSDARNAAKETGFPSIVFWDEIESIAGKRKDSATYTPEKTVVPTLLAEIQGVKSDDEVILVGASNMPNIIDPALMRPGRLGDAIIEIPRPSREAALDILKANLIRGEVSNSLKKLMEENINERLVAHIYDNEKPLAVATLKSGKKVPLMRQEQVSGALFAQLGEEIVRSLCISEIQNIDPIDIDDSIELAENIMLNQIGVLDSNVKNGFTFNTEDYVLDVSLGS